MTAGLAHILIDMGGVLCRNDEGPVWRSWEQHTGLPGETLRAELYDRGLKEEFDRGLKHPGGIAMFLGVRFNVELSLDDWSGIWNRAVEPDPEMDAFAKSLAAQVPCSLASTTDMLHHEKLRREMSCMARFEHEFVSYRLGHIKPDAMFYARIIEQLNADPSRVLFIDDREENVRGAANAGMTALAFRGMEDLRQRLREYGLRA